MITFHHLSERNKKLIRIALSMLQSACLKGEVCELESPDRVIKLIEVTKLIEDTTKTHVFFQETPGANKK